jgi:hypothetical protein
MGQCPVLEENLFLTFLDNNQMKNIQTITSIYPSWNYSDIAFIKALEWSNDDLIINFYSQSRSVANGWPNLTQEFLEISIKFQKVQNIKLDFKGKGIHQVSGFDIIDISENGLENINFQIEDYENGSIEFLCEDAMIISISKPVLLSL